MAVTNEVLGANLNAGELFEAADRYKFVVTSDANEVSMAAGATVPITGIVENYGAAGDALAVVTAGVFKVLCGGSFSAGAKLTSDGNGAAIATTTAGHYVGAEAIDDGADGQYARVRLVSYTVPA